MPSRLYRGLSSGGKYEGVGDIGRALTGIGVSLVKTENKTRYDTQTARAEAQKLRDKNVLDSKLEEHSSNPELWESDFDDWFTNTYEKNVTADVSDPVALRDLQNSIVIDKEVIRKDVLKRAALQDKENSNNAYVAMNLELQNRDFKSPVDLQAASNDYHKTTLEMMKTGDVNGLETPERFVESYDKNWSATTVRFLLQNPDRVNEDGTVDEDYWINHPNEFADNYGLNAAINRPLFTKDEIVDLKKEHSARKKFIETEAKKAREGREHEVETEAREFAINGNWGAGIEAINKGLNEFGVDWHTDALNKYRNAYSIQNQTGVNVYKTTHNPTAFGEMRDRILAGTATEKDIRAGVGPDGYSTTDEGYLIKLLEGDESKAKAFEDTAAAKDLMDLIDFDPETDPEYNLELNKFAKQKGLALLKDAIERADPPLNNQEKREEAMRIARQIGRDYESGLLETGLEEIIKQTPITRQRGDFAKIGLAPGKFHGNEEMDIDFGLRPDGTEKGNGYLGVLSLPNGGVATEYTVQSDAVKVDGKRIDFPTLVPTLTKKEIALMVNDIIPNRKPIPEPIMQKAIKHAKKRLQEGKSVFADNAKKPTQGEFTKTVARLKRAGKMKEAREYYDKWIGILWQ